MDRLQSMEVFARVVEAESYTKAASRLGMSRAAVSKRVIDLEQQLGVRLLTRTTRRVSPTEIGLAYYDRCMRVLTEAAEADSLARRLQSEPEGALRINAPQSFGILHLGPAIAEFAVAYPDIRINLTLNDRFVNLANEDYDLAIRVARGIEKGMTGHRIAPIRIVLCASPDYLQRRGEPASPSDLAGHSCLEYSYLASGDEWRFSGPDGEHALRVSGTFGANNGDVLKQAALAGLGIGHLPTFLVDRELADGSLQVVLPGFEIPELGLFAAHLADRRPSTKVRLLVEFLSDRFGPVPYWDAIG